MFESNFKSFLNKINPLHMIILNIEKKGFSQKNLKKIIANSQMIKDELLSNFKINHQKIQVIYNGVEIYDLE